MQLADTPPCFSTIRIRRLHGARTRGIGVASVT
jgi:hypothetical protein